ncbi:MAG: pyruvate ferredoxin oxidoreductase [Lewinellaceae bacterium]|nr:pyruvate ferredoxin oxidoreductase [Lewinellaceae bacterium]MCB9290318.1 pyruvate ferredoxin oxidoreductase [Lewinellaceae bacterium]
MKKEKSQNGNGIALEEPLLKASKYPRHIQMVMKGNYAAAEAARLCRAGFIPAYPITPQTTIVERLSELVAEGKIDATYINMDSEHSVFAAAMGAAIGGERVFTATAGQGLFYAHEVLQAIAHFRLPMVVCNVGRPSIPWNIWSDQSDSLSQRDTGWIQFYGESSQEVLDTIIQAYVLTEKVRIPVLVVLDAFYQSHTSENVWVPGQNLVDRFLPPIQPGPMTLDIKHPRSFGGLLPPEHYNRMNYSFWKAMNEVENKAEEIATDFGAHFGRPYSNVEAVNIGPQTKLVLVTLSSITTTARGVIRDYPEIGLLKLRLFKPFPKEAVRRALAPLSGDALIAIVERNFLGDNEGAIMQEMKRALYGASYKMYDFFAGTGGKDVPPVTIEKIIHRAFHQPEEANWIDVG